MNITLIKAFGDFLDQHGEILAGLQKKAQQYDMHGVLSKAFIEQEVLPIARANGFEITASDLKQCGNHILLQNGNLSLEELEAVAGGAGTRFISAGILSLMMISNLSSLQPASAMMASGSFGNSSTSSSQPAQIAENVEDVDGNLIGKSGLRYEKDAMDDVVDVAGLSKKPTAGTLTIPSAIRTLDGKIYRVRALEYECFKDVESLQKVVLSEGIEQIGNHAFSRSNLQEIVIPGSVKDIGDYTFHNCKKLQNVIIHDNVQTIGDYAFQGCINLKNIIIPDSVTTIGVRAFDFCKSLQRITIPASVTTIREGTFSACTALEYITISENVTSIESMAFNNCKKLGQVEIKNAAATIDEHAFYNINQSAWIRIHQPINNVKNMFFVNCKANIYGEQYNERLRKNEWVLDAFHQDRTVEEYQRREQLRQEQLRQEQLRQEQLQQEQLRQERLRQERLLQEQLQQEQLRQEQAQRIIQVFGARDQDDFDPTDECSICIDSLGELDGNGNPNLHVCKLGCGHAMHAGCLAKLLEVDNKCPYCRAEIQPIPQ